ncbi:MAG: PDZ domain-containing protein [Planctomycetaceae bacterium]|nr:PDZ domain-containing protein [Planctomycetaceae bacterium]
MLSRFSRVCLVLAVASFPICSVQAQQATAAASAKVTPDESAQTKPNADTKAETAAAAASTNEPPKEAAAKTASAKREKKTGRSTAQRLNAIEEKIDGIQKAISSLNEDTAEKPTAKPTGQKPASEEKSAGESAAEAKAVPASKPATADRGKLPARLKMKDEWLKNVPWRSIGPANMSGRITDLLVHDQDPSLWYIATAGGGLLKTANQGVTIEHQFDKQTSVSIGAIASDPNNKDVIWVGTGEANPRNSVSYGDGVYKSTDGGKTFEHMGLKETFQIGRICVDPQNPDTVYVGALGRLYGTSRERGVYKTTDGGKSWEQVLYVDDETGVIDMIMHPEDPGVLIAAMWTRQRDGFDSWPGSVKKPDGVDGYDPIKKYGKGGGLYKTSDGGETWTKLENGLPTSATGRIGLDWQSGGSHSIYAIIDCEDIGKGPKPFTAFLGAVGSNKTVEKKTIPTIVQILPDSPAAKAGLVVGDVLQKVEGKDVSDFDELLEVLRKKKIGQNVTLTYKRGEESKDVKIRLSPRPGSNQQMPTVWLGVTGESKDSTVVLKSVVDNSPAAKAELKVDDVITQLDGKDIASYEKMIETVQGKADGDTIKLTVKRGEESKDITVTLANRPTQQRRSGQSSGFMGIQGEDADGKGARLTVITEGGPTEKAGIKAGDVVVKVGEKKIADYAGLVTEIRAREAGDKMKVEVKRGEKIVKAEITLGDRRGGGSSGTRPYTFSYFGQQANIQDMQGADGHKYGGIYKSTDAGETWQRVNSLNTRPMYFSLIRVDPSDDQRVYILGVSQFRSSNGGATFTADFGRGVHADGHDLWIDPADGRHMVIAGDGGFYATYDYGDNWDHINNAAIGQFYHVAISPKKPYWVVGGLQDNGSWAGPAISRTGGAINEDWISVAGGDGFVCRVDPNDPDLMYYESQNGNIGRRHLKTGERASIRPARARGVEYRFNWNTPFILSNHNSRIFYSAGNYVFKSLDRGNDLRRISPEITLTKRGSATALSESPRNPDVLYVGTDDGALWVTKDGGDNWTDITENLGIADPRWVNTIEASRYATGRVYVVLDGHRSDDDNPYVFVSEDYGATFAPLHQGLPWGTSRCLREDTSNPNLLYLGTEVGFWVSIDRGQTWAKFNQNLPVVAIHDIALHPANGEIVVATHGRSLWACDVTGLRAVNTDNMKKSAVFYKPEDVTRWRTEPRRGRTNRRYVGQNPARGANLWYSLPKDVEKATIRVENVSGQLVSELPASKEAGLHRVNWNLTQSSRGRTPRQSSGFRGGFNRPVSSGAYKVTLMLDDDALTSHVINVVSDPSLPVGAVSDEEYETMLLIDEMKSQKKWDAKTEGRDYYTDD